MIHTRTTYEAECDFCGHVFAAASSHDAPEGWSTVFVEKRRDDNTLSGRGPMYDTITLLGCPKCREASARLERRVGK